MMYLFFVCFSKSSLGSSSAAYHPRWSPYRDMMPTYNQLAASSLLNQQYSAALGLGKIHDALDRSDVWHVIFGPFFPPVLWCVCGCFSRVCVCIYSWSSRTMFIPIPSVPGLHGIPARRAPMVEQAVQTVPLANAAQKRGNTLTQPQGRQPVRPTQRSGRGGSQVQKENVPTSKQTQQWLIREIVHLLFHALLPFSFKI